jgi:hypothetical protein
MAYRQMAAPKIFRDSRQPLPPYPESSAVQRGGREQAGVDVADAKPH